MSTVSDDPRFNRASYEFLGSFERRLRSRVLNLLEDRMLRERRDRITEDDVRASVEEAIKELLESLERKDEHTPS